jgi:hypothetical protein
MSKGGGKYRISRHYRLSVRENSPNKLKVAGVVVGAVVGDQ